MELVVGTGSTWSLRAWMCARLAGITISEQVIDLNSDGYKTKVLKHSPAGLVPVLKNGPLVIHDSLAIIEYLNECSHGSLFPNSEEKRAQARSLCAELHSGFMTLRAQCPFSLKEVVLFDEPDEVINKEIARIKAIFEQATNPFMFDKEGAVDAFYAILAFRLNSYGIRFQGKAGDYQKSLLAWRILTDAIKHAGEWE